MKKTKTSDIKIKPIPGVDRDGKKGNAFFDRPNSNVFLLAPKQSGKTTVIYNILEGITDDDTIVIFFAGKIHKDPSYKAAIKMLKDKNIKHIKETSFFKEIDGKKENQLKKLLDHLSNGDDDDSDDEFLEDSAIAPRIENPKKGEEFNYKEPGKITKRYGVKVPKSFANRELSKNRSREVEYMNPLKYIFVIDDLSNEIRYSSDLTALLKSNDHLNATVLVASQSKTDLQPGTINNLDFLIIFANIPKDKLEAVHRDIGSVIDFNTFYKIYLDATNEEEKEEVSKKSKEETEKRKNFLVIDVKKKIFKKNFNETYNIEK